MPSRILSVDFGGTSVNALLSLDGWDEAARDFSSADMPVSWAGVKRILAAMGAERVDGVIVTGGSNAAISSQDPDMPVVHIPEIDAIGLGGLSLAGIPEALVVSLGTGTAMVAAHDRVFRHVGGSGLGGGTLLGLSRLLLQTTNFSDLESLARAGAAGAVDLSVQDIVGGAIGIVPADSTASNFGKAARLARVRDLSRPDIARGIVTMVGQTVARLALVIAKAEQLDQVVVIGHVIESPVMQSVFTSVAGLFGGTFIFPDHARQGVVRGAFEIGKEQFV